VPDEYAGCYRKWCVRGREVAVLKRTGSVALARRDSTVVSASYLAAPRDQLLLALCDALCEPIAKGHGD